jgi:hypothetical protein
MIEALQEVVLALGLRRHDLHADVFFTPTPPHARRSRRPRLRREQQVLRALPLVALARCGAGAVRCLDRRPRGVGHGEGRRAPPERQHRATLAVAEHRDAAKAASPAEQWQRSAAREPPPEPL